MSLVLALILLSAPAFAQEGGGGPTVIRPRGAVRQLLGETRWEGRIDRPRVRRAISARVPAFRRCYEHVLREQPGLRGKVVIRFAITPAGRVSEASIESSEMEHPALQGCLVAVFRRFLFEPHSHPTPVIVHWALAFRPLE